MNLSIITISFLLFGLAVVVVHGHRLSPDINEDEQDMSEMVRFSH